MKYITLGNSQLSVSQLALGLMRSSLYEAPEMQILLEKALELNINFLDHADIYAWKNNAEEVFGQVIKSAPYLRDKFVIQTKCGICRGYYDSSYEHIIESVDTSLKRMNLDYIDVLLLHRPDALMEPEEIARAFDQLQAAGKVKYFGVSNMNPAQMQLIKRNVTQDLIVNQVQFGLVHASLIDEGIYVNTKNEGAVMRDGNLLEYAQLNNITLQAWSFLQTGWKKGTFLEHPDYPDLNQVLERLSHKYHVPKSAVATAWILRHPANIQPISGTTNPIHLEELTKAFDFTLTRPEWYELYLATGKPLP